MSDVSDELFQRAQDVMATLVRGVVPQRPLSDAVEWFIYQHGQRRLLAMRAYDMRTDRDRYCFEILSDAEAVPDVSSAQGDGAGE